MTRRERNRIVTAINKQFIEIGKDMPASTSNMSPAAWEYYIASHLSSLASGRTKTAKATAIKVGVLPDVDEQPLPPGEYKPVFDGEHVAIDLTVRSPAKTVDATKLVDFLLGAGISQDVLDRAITHASKTSRAAHIFASHIKVEDDDE